MMAGHRLGAIEIRRRLGKGGVGEVHLGYDTHLDRNVAVKALRPEFAHDPAFVKRFVGEAQHLARLNHPNIATLYSLHNDGRELCMVMEYIDGQTLDDIAASVRLDEADALAIAAQAMEGLAYAHGMGVVHRDIKPANLMVNGAGTLKIMDFGIARLQGSERMTRHGAIVGSIAYMAPEQILGREGDERSDIYSLAVVLYELLCAVPPFSCDSEYALMKAQIETDPPRLLDHLPEVRCELDGAIMRALAKAPEDRFASVAEFRDALFPSGVNLGEAARRLKGRFAAAPTWGEAPPIGSETRLPEPPGSGAPGDGRTDPPGAGKPQGVPPAPRPARRGSSELWPRLILAGAALFSIVTLGAIALDMSAPSKPPPAPGPDVRRTALTDPARSDAKAQDAPVPPAEAKEANAEPPSTSLAPPASGEDRDAGNRAEAPPHVLPPPLDRQVRQPEPEPGAAAVAPTDSAPPVAEAVARTPPPSELPRPVASDGPLQPPVEEVLKRSGTEGRDAWSPGWIKR